MNFIGTFSAKSLMHFDSDDQMIFHKFSTFVFKNIGRILRQITIIYMLFQVEVIEMTYIRMCLSSELLKSSMSCNRKIVIVELKIKNQLILFSIK